MSAFPCTLDLKFFLPRNIYPIICLDMEVTIINVSKFVSGL